MKKRHAIALIGALLSGLGLVQPGVSSAAITCGNNQVLTGPINGSVLINSGFCFLNGAIVSGSITQTGGTVHANVLSVTGGGITQTGGSMLLFSSTVNGSVKQTGGALSSFGSTIKGSLVVTGTDAGSSNEVCGGSIGGSVTVADSMGTAAPEFFRLLGSGTTNMSGLACPPLTLSGTVTFKDNRIFTRLANATVKSSVVVTNNQSTDFTNEPGVGSSVIAGNTITGTLTCTGNVPPPTPFSGPNMTTPNTAAAKKGQCTAALGF